MLKRYLLLVLSGVFFSTSASAIVLAPESPPEKQAPSSKSATPAAPTQKSNNSPVKASKATVQKPAPLPPPSKASLGFYQAALNANYDMMELYLQQGADINCLNCDRYYQWTALYRALGINDTWNFQLADWLIQRGADINKPAIINSVSGSTLVMAAAGYSNMPNYSALNNLIQRGADFKSVDSMGRTALHYIREWNLIDSPYGDYSRNFVSSVALLIENGIDVNWQDKSGTTALMNAAGDCSPGSVRLLISNGANTALKNKLGKSAMDVAMDRATQSGQNSPCNDVIKILSNAPQASQSTPVQSSTYSKPTQQSEANFAGTYGGSYNGPDVGTFQVTITDDGLAKLSGRSSKMGTNFTGEGKVSPDGSVAVGSASTGSTFTGSISRSGVLSGTWKNTAYNQAGSFEGKKGAVMADAKPNPIEALGTGLRILNSILAPR